MTADCLPRAGEDHGLYYATGYSGHGVRMSVRMGPVMAEIIAGRPELNPWRGLEWPAIPGHFGTSGSSDRWRVLPFSGWCIDDVQPQVAEEGLSRLRREKARDANHIGHAGGRVRAQSLGQARSHGRQSTLRYQ